VSGSGNGLEQARIVECLVFQFGGRQDQPDVAIGYDGAGDRVIERLQADQYPRARVLELVGEFAFPVHGVDRDQDSARFPRRQHRDHELRDVLEIYREPVASVEPVGAQACRECRAQRVDLAPGEAAVEVLDGRVVGAGRDRGSGHGQAA